VTSTTDTTRLADRLRPETPPERPLKVFYWPASMEDGCYSYRIKMPGERLAQLGHHVDTSQRVSPWAREEADIIVGQRVALAPASAMWQMLANEGRLKLVYEVDDDLFHLDSRTNPMWDIFHRPGVRENMITNIRVAHMVTVTTEPLAELLSRWNNNVVVLPNCVRREVFDIPAPLRRGQPDGLTIYGWQGSPTHADDWKVCQPAVKAVLEADDATRMRFLGHGYPEGLPKKQAGWMAWQPDLMKHYKRVSRFDATLAPLTGSRFNDSKSGLRVQESFALGVPAVASDVPAYRPWVRHGTTGFLVRSTAQWAHAMMALRDPALRAEMGAAAREAAVDWTIERRAPQWVAAYRTLL
jgi:hypothetical protein